MIISKKDNQDKQNRSFFYVEEINNVFQAK